MELTHILERAMIHIFSSAGVYLAVMFTLAWIRRRWPYMLELVMPAILVVLFIGWNEVVNINDGQSYVKAFTDLASWVVGMGLTIWGLIRWRRPGK